MARHAGFAEIKNMSVKLTPEEDQYDFHGYSMNKKLCLRG